MEVLALRAARPPFSLFYNVANKGWVNLRGRPLFLTALFCLFVAFGSVFASAAPDTLIVVTPSDIITLDPARYTTHLPTEIVQRLIYAPLFDRDEATFVAAAATSLTARDPLTWVVDLAPGLTTHQGQSITPSRVAQYINRLTSETGIGGYPAPARDRLGPVERASVVDGKLVLHLSRPWPSLPARLMAEPVAILDSQGQPIGTGPFRVERWDRGNRVVLERVDDTSDQGMIRRIQFEVVPSADERLRRVLNGEAHIAFELPPGAFWRLRASRQAKPVVVPQSRVHFMEFAHTKPPFDDQKVRQALNMAVNTPALLRQLAQGETEAVATALSPVTLGFASDVLPYRYDPERARQLLAEAGYPQGFAFELDVTRVKERVGRMYQAMLSEVGIDVSLRVWDTWQALREQILLGRRHAWLAEWGNSSLDPGTAIRPKLHSKGEANYGGYDNPVLDAMLDEADAILDPIERLEQYKLIQSYIRDDAPMLFGYVEYDVFGASVHLDWWPGPGRWLALDEARWIE